MIEFRNITKIYNPKKGNKKIAINDISFKLPDKGIFFLLGKSGSGKTTLLNILGTLDRPTTGKILVDNKDISKLKEKDLTSYRSQNIGFIFQEFNLIEDLNVYDNISLSLSLNNIKVNKEDITKILELVGLNNLEKRKVNELSGGEKQRVAIARAVIKNPTLILADEPTGNLDVINSKQVFEILKIISKRCLVLVVSHDKESANNYADGIIEISDGKIINNTINVNNNIENSEIKNKKLSLGILPKLKLSLGMLKKKKIRLIFTILLITIAFTLFGFSSSLRKFDMAKTHAESMIKENEKSIVIKKYKNRFLKENYITDQEVLNITNKLNSSYNKEAYLYVENNPSNLAYYVKKTLNDINEAAYYGLSYNTPKFIIYNDENLKDLEILGKYPENSHEVLINDLLADYLVTYGFERYDYEDKFISKYTEKLVSNKEELLNEYLYLENTYVKIVGIIKDNSLKKYDSLKEENYFKMEAKPTKLYQEFKSIYEKSINNFIISDKFIDSDFLENNEIDTSIFNIIPKIDDKEEYSVMGYYKIFNDEIEVYNGNDNVKINTLKDDEIILSQFFIEEFYQEEFGEKYNQEFEKIKKEYQKKVQEREDKLKEQEKILESNPDYIPKDIPEVIFPDVSYLDEQVSKEVFKEKELYNKEISIEIIDKNYIVSNNRSKIYNFKIKGMQVNNQDTLTTYFPQSFKNYTLPNLVTASININEDDENKLTNIFKDFENSNYLVETRFSNTINNVAKVVLRIERIANYLTIGFLIFSFILLTLFISSNLNVNKRKIGILRALGTSIKDIVNIFLLESLIIGIFTFILSSILTYISIDITNNYITKEFFFYLKPIVFSNNIILSILFIIIVTLLISNIIPTIKLSKNDPIKLISEK